MRVSVLADANWETKVDHALRVLQLHNAFEDDFGVGLANLVVGLNCRDPRLGHKQRVRLNNETATLYVDVMLAHGYFVYATHVARRAKIAEEVVAQVAPVLAKRKIKNFAAQAFIAKLTDVLHEQLNGPTSTRFDHLSLERAAGT
jgi:hypothetical protein